MEIEEVRPFAYLVLFAYALVYAGELGGAVVFVGTGS